MQVDVHALKDFHIDAEGSGTRLDIGQRGLARLLHDLTQLAGHLQGALAFEDGDFDGHDLAAVFRPGQRLHNADLIGFFDLRRNVLRRIEELLDEIAQ